MMSMIEDHYLKIKPNDQRTSWRMGARILDQGVRGQNLKKGGVRGGSQKSPNFAHGGGNLGGAFFGGVPKNRDHKTWSFMRS